MATSPVVTPYVLLKELAAARRRGPVGDPYGLTTAVKSFTGSLDDMRKSQLADLKMREEAMRLNQLPLQQEQLAAHYALQKYQDQQKLQVAQDLQQAVEQAKMLNDPMAYDFPLTVAKFVKTPGAMQELQKAIPHIQKEAENREAQASLMKQGVKKEQYEKKRKELYDEEINNSVFKFEGPTAEQDRAKTLQRIRDKANKDAERYVDKLELDVQIDPVTRKFKVFDKDGQLYAPNPNLQSIVMAVGGNKNFLEAQNAVEKNDWLYGGQRAQAEMQKQQLIAQRAERVAQIKASNAKMGRTEQERRLEKAHSELQQIENRIDHAMATNPGVEIDARLIARKEAKEIEIEDLENNMRGVAPVVTDKGRYTGKSSIPSTPTVPTSNIPFYDGGKAFDAEMKRLREQDSFSMPSAAPFEDEGMVSMPSVAVPPIRNAALPMSPNQPPTLGPGAGSEAMFGFTPPWLDWIRRNAVEEKDMYGVPAMPAAPGL